MSITVTMTEAEVQKVASSIGRELTRKEAAVVLDEAEIKILKDHAEGKIRIFDDAVLRVLRGQL